VLASRNCLDLLSHGGFETGAAATPVAPVAYSAAPATAPDATQDEQ
jgi:hypothetical protein